LSVLNIGLEMVWVTASFRVNGLDVPNAFCDTHTAFRQAGHRLRETTPAVHPPQTVGQVEVAVSSTPWAIRARW